MSSGFVTEAEIAEARRQRQEQWQRVRTADQPDEAPEEPYDPRPLFQRLEEQKLKKDAEYEEAHKLKNMIRGLDDDEVGFLEMVEQSKASAAKKISIEEQREMKEFRERVITVQDSVERERLQQLNSARPSAIKKTTINSTRNMLKGAIVRKRKASENDSDKADEPVSKSNGKHTEKAENSSNEDEKDSGEPVVLTVPQMGALQCVGILPGIGPYRDSSDSENSSDSDDEHSHPHFDLLGRKVECKVSTQLKDKK